jgi:hypothetical protein
MPVTYRLPFAIRLRLFYSLEDVACLSLLAIPERLQVGKFDGLVS